MVMHIPGSMLQGAVCPVTALVSGAGLGLSVWLAVRSDRRPSAGRFAAVTAFIFAGQMLNFPIGGGTSGHLLGGVLAAALLGVPFGVLAMALVLAVQAVVFADGGITVLGANILNMAILGAGVWGWLRERLTGAEAGFGVKKAALLAGAAWGSVMLAALACSVELAAAGTARFSTAAGAMLGTHAWIGLGEAGITVLGYALLAGRVAEGASRKTVLVPLLGAAVMALVISPFASSYPDGLEWVAQQYEFYRESAPLFVSPLAAYGIAAVPNGLLSTALAGLAGVLMTFGLGWAAGRVWQVQRVRSGEK